MTSTKSPGPNPANRSVDRPEDAQVRRNGADATASTRLAMAKPLFGGELSGAVPTMKEEATADALKRTAENERRS